MMIAQTKLTVLPEHRKEFFQSIGPLSERIRKENGCVNFVLYAAAGDENSFMLIEDWETESQWMDHRTSENFSILTGLVSAVSISSKTDFKLLSPIGEAN
jgi:quinol monooxygenase YgiN